MKILTSFTALVAVLSIASAHANSNFRNHQTSPTSNTGSTTQSGGSLNTASPPKRFAKPLLEDPAPPPIQAYVTKAKVIGNDPRQCVLYARSKLSTLPYGLTSYDDKVRIVNNSKPLVGAVAIIDMGNSTGHVAYVERAVAPYRGAPAELEVSESNYISGKVTTRTAYANTLAEAQSLLRITGYFK